MITSNEIKWVKGKDLTPQQVKQLPFNGRHDPQWVVNHTFAFKNGQPVPDIYPVCHSLTHLPN